jgi:hypothetical protein
MTSQKSKTQIPFGDDKPQKQRQIPFGDDKPKKQTQEQIAKNGSSIVRRIQRRKIWMARLKPRHPEIVPCNAGVPTLPCK